MKKIIYSLIILGLVAVIGCNTKPKELRNVTVDTKFNELYHLDSGGITGADGSISIALPDGSSIFMTGDCFLGKVKNNSRDTNTTMINNSLILINKEQNKVTALYNGTYDSPKSFLAPEDEPGKFYWPGHGFVRDSVIHMFMSKFWFASANSWGFEFLDTDYFRLSWPDFKLLSKDNFTYTDVNKVHWGHAVLDDGKYVFIYGTRTDKDSLGTGVSKAFVCRAIVGDNKVMDRYEFFNGSGWEADPAKVKGLEGISCNVSEQFSVFKYKEKYVFLTQQRGIGTGEIYTFISDSPTGPWENKKMIYRTTENEKDSSVITYNAMAHPQYIEDDKLLICYNVNSLNPPDIMKDVRKYRPVFLRVPLEMILEPEVVNSQLKK